MIVTRSKALEVRFFSLTWIVIIANVYQVQNLQKQTTGTRNNSDITIPVPLVERL